MKSINFLSRFFHPKNERKKERKKKAYYKEQPCNYFSVIQYVIEMYKYCKHGKSECKRIRVLF